MRTMKPWIARTLRRTLLLGVMVLGAQALLYRALYADPDLPPADADRVEVLMWHGRHYEIHDAGMVARAAGFVRSLDGPWTRVPGPVHPAGLPRAAFYRGDRPFGWIMWSDRVAIVPAGDAMAVFYINPGETAALDALLGITGAR